MTDIDTIRRRMLLGGMILSIGVAVLAALAFIFTLFVWMKSVDGRIHALNNRVQTLEAMHGYAIDGATDGATHDKHLKDSQ